jgi:hypothetical protein
VANLYTADVYAYQIGHADVVTNSWGSGEFSGETSEESIFSASTVPLLFSAGDTGAVPEYPCMSAFTVCVGGTKLLLTPTSFRNIESAWGTDSSGGGGGCSLYITAPSFQSGFSTADCGTFRGAPDVSADADEYTGMNTYLGAFAALGLSSSCTPALCPPGGYVIGGSSLAPPLTAGVIANIDADRVFNGKTKLGAGTNHEFYAAGRFVSLPLLRRHYRQHRQPRWTGLGQCHGFRSHPRAVFGGLPAYLAVTRQWHFNELQKGPVFGSGLFAFWPRLQAAWRELVILPAARSAAPDPCLPSIRPFQARP